MRRASGVPTGQTENFCFPCAGLGCVLWSLTQAIWDFCWPGMTSPPELLIFLEWYTMNVLSWSRCIKIKDWFADISRLIWWWFQRYAEVALYQQGRQKISLAPAATCMVALVTSRLGKRMIGIGMIRFGQNDFPLKGVGSPLIPLRNKIRQLFLAKKH